MLTDKRHQTMHPTPLQSEARNRKDQLMLTYLFSNNIGIIILIRLFREANFVLYRDKSDSDLSAIAKYLILGIKPILFGTNYGEYRPHIGGCSRHYGAYKRHYGW
jgi:hypothetical protein